MEPPPPHRVQPRSVAGRGIRTIRAIAESSDGPRTVTELSLEPADEGEPAVPVGIVWAETVSGPVQAAVS